MTDLQSYQLLSAVFGIGLFLSWCFFAVFAFTLLSKSTRIYSPEHIKALRDHRRLLEEAGAKAEKLFRAKMPNPFIAEEQETSK